MQKKPSYGEVYNDLDRRVVNVFRVLQSPRLSKLLETKLRSTPFAREELELSYKPGRSSVEEARRTIIAAFMGFGADSVTRGTRTGFRNNANKSGTTPAHDWRRWPDQIPLFTDRLKYVIIENRDAIEVMASQDGPDTVHYVDPPYVKETRADCHGYNHDFTDQQHRDLVEYLTTLNGYVLLSAYPHEIYNVLLTRGWARVDAGVHVFRQTKRVENLWLNPRAVEAQAQMHFEFGG